MEIRILTFGAARELTGSGAVAMPYMEGMTVMNVINELRSKFPGLNKLSSFAIAVNGEYAGKETVIKKGDELAIIPPVSGG